MEIAISCVDVSKRFGKLVVLPGVSLDVQAGTIVGLLGPSGSGKTTLIRCLAGLLRPEGGSIQVLGRPLGPAIRRSIGYTPQQPALYPELTLEQNLAFFGRMQGLRGRGLHERMEEQVALVGLGAALGRPVRTFSGGMRQRASLAAALLHKPPVLFLDEPTVGLDPLLRAQIWNAFYQLSREGVTLFVSTHQMDEALYCQRVAIMREGRILAYDTPDALLARQPGQLILTLADGRRLERPIRRAEELVEAIRGEPAAVGAEYRPPTMERVFLDLIGDAPEAPVPAPAGAATSGGNGSC